jgi:hypothetical protein
MDFDLPSKSYKQYKVDTDFVANWLAVTARNCGYVAAAPPAKTAP